MMGFLGRRPLLKGALGAYSTEAKGKKVTFPANRALLGAVFPLTPAGQFRHCGSLRQTPSTGLRQPSFGGRCRKAVLGVRACGSQLLWCYALPLCRARHGIPWTQESRSL